MQHAAHADSPLRAEHVDAAVAFAVGGKPTEANAALHVQKREKQTFAVTESGAIGIKIIIPKSLENFCVDVPQPPFEPMTSGRDK